METYRARYESLAVSFQVGNWRAHFAPTTLARRHVPVLRYCAMAIKGKALIQ